MYLAFKNADGTEFLGYPFGRGFEARINGDSPDPVQVGSVFCSDINGVLAQIKRAQKARGIIGVRSLFFSPAAPEEDVDDGIQPDLDFDSEDDIPNAEGPTFLTADDDFTAP